MSLLELYRGKGNGLEERDLPTTVSKKNKKWVSSCCLSLFFFIRTLSIYLGILAMLLCYLYVMLDLVLGGKREKNVGLRKEKEKST